jgi:hypothetical protein
MNVQFYTTDNLKNVISICKEYLNDKYNYKVEDELNLKKVIYDIMTIVNSEHKHHYVKLQELNIEVLQNANKYYIRKYNLKTPSRDQKSVVTAIIPEINTYNKKNTDNKEYSIERLTSERDADIGIKKTVPDISRLGTPINEIAESTDDFLKKLQSLESERKRVDDGFARMQQSKEIMEFNTIEKQNEARKILYGSVNKEPENILSLNDKFLDGKESIIIPKNLKQKIIEKYLSISSYDRDIMLNPYRYIYNINFQNKSNDFQNRYRNIDSLSVSKVIIPDEIIQFSDPIKTTFNYEFTFNYPYLLLQINEFDDIYDGTSNSVRKTFCKLVYHQSYKSQNGRGYIILKPSQKEKKYFYPAPLTALTKFSISILKPDGELFNKSADNYNILQITYNSSIPNYILITTNLYFDENEFYINDRIVINNYTITDDSANQTDVKSFNNFVNNLAGHEILLLGPANLNGYYNSFYIQAPGYFDKTIGEFSLNNTLISCLNNYNIAIGSPIINGTIINSSLQHSIDMKANIIVDDAKILETNFNF